MPKPQTGGQDELTLGLLALRKAAGLSGAKAAALAGSSQSKISRIESGRSIPDPDFIASLCHAYGATAAERGRLVALARDVKAGNRRVVLHRPVAGFQRRIGRIQRQSALVRTFATVGIPGLLQTGDYARALFSSRPGRSPEDAEAGARARLENQAILDDPDCPRRFVMLMTEGALGWSVGPPELMEAQMEHLAAATRRGNARVGIIPFGAWSPNIPLPLHGWELYDERFVIAGTITATATLDNPRDVARYVELFEELEHLAMFGNQARDILARVAGRYRQLG